MDFFIKLIQLIRLIAYALLTVSGLLCIIVCAYNEASDINVLLLTVGIFAIIYSIKHVISGN